MNTLLALVRRWQEDGGARECRDGDIGFRLGSGTYRLECSVRGSTPGGHPISVRHAEQRSYTDAEPVDAMQQLLGRCMTEYDLAMSGALVQEKTE